MKFRYSVFLALAGAATALRLRNAASLQSTEKLAAKSESQVQFVDQLLMAVLQMLLGNSNSALPTAAPGAGEQNGEELTEEGLGGSPEGGANAGLGISGGEAPSGGVPSGWPANGEALLQAALTSQSNSQNDLTQQINALSAEIQDLKALKDYEAQAGAEEAGPDNAIQLTIQYPGSSAKAPPLPAEPANTAPLEQSMETPPSYNPLKLHVPLVVISPIQPDLHQLLLKTVKEAQRAGTEAALAEDLQQELQKSPEDRLRADVTAYKNAASQAAFFRNDLTLTEKRIGITEGAGDSVDEAEEDAEDEEEEEEENIKKDQKKRSD